MATRTISTAGGSWNTTGAWAEGAVPTAADDVVATATSGNITVTASSVCRSMDLTSYVGTMSGSGDISIGDGSGGACTLAGTISGTWTTTFKSTSNNGGAGWNITSNGKTFPGAVGFNNASGKWVLADAFVGAGSVTLTAGTWDTAGKSVSCSSFSSNNTNTRTLTLGASSFTLTAGAGFAISPATNMTLSAGTSTLTFTNAFPNFSPGALSYNNVVFNNLSNGNPTGGISGAATMANLTLSCAASNKAVVWQIFSNLTITGTFTLGGPTTQGNCRLLLCNPTPGSVPNLTMTGGAVVITGDVDFMDINITGSPSWTNTGNAFIGDCLGNGSLIVANRTTPATQTHTTSAGGNWSDATKWTSRVPLPQDDVVVNANTTGTLTVDMPRLGANINFTGFAGTLTFTGGGNTTLASFGNLTWGSGSTMSGTPTWTLGGRGAQTITTNGKVSPMNKTIAAPGGSYTLQDADLSGSTSGLTVSQGTFSSNNFSMSYSFFGSSGSSTRTVTLGTSTLTLASSTGGFAHWNCSTSTNLTMNAASSTIVFSARIAASRTFAGGGMTYGTLTYTVANSPGALIITGANTFATLNVGSGRTLTMPSSTTNTVTNFNVNGVNNGYLRLPGVAGNYASAPDSAALSITGDIDLRAALTMDDWTPSALTTILNKYNESSAPNRSYELNIQTSGLLTLQWTSDGSTGLSATSTVAPTVADGALLLIRATLDVDNGATGRDIAFYTKTSTASAAHADLLLDTGWTQLGTTVTQAGVTSIYDGTELLFIGQAKDNGSGRNPLTGNVYAAVIKAGISGTTAFDADFTTKTVGANTFTESSSNAATVTINGVLAQAGDGRVAITSSTNGVAGTISSPNRVSCDYLTIQDSTAAGNVPFYAGANSVNISNNTNWSFTAAPSGNMFLVF